MKAGQADNDWTTPICVPEASFDFESALATSIKMEELYGHLDDGELGYGIFNDSPLTSPEPTPPPSPTQPTTWLDTLDTPLGGSLSPPNPPQMPEDLPLTAAGTPGPAKTTVKKYLSNKVRSHAKRKRERANKRKEREAGDQPYDAQASTRLRHVHSSSPMDAKLDLAGIPISAPGYIGLREKIQANDRAQYKLEDLVGEGSRYKFKLVKWDGR
jgi:hypothetical protein